MESGKTLSNVVPALQGVDRWRAFLEETDRLCMQKQILSEASFSSSEGEVVSPFGGRRVIQRSLEEESRFSYESSGDESEDSDS